LTAPASMACKCLVLQANLLPEQMTQGVMLTGSGPALSF
jgi:hypothetical protein